MANKWSTKGEINDSFISKKLINIELQSLNFLARTDSRSLKNNLVANVLYSEYNIPYFSPTRTLFDGFLSKLSDPIAMEIILTRRNSKFSEIRGVSKFSAKSIRNRLTTWWKMQGTQILVHFRSSQNWVAMH